MSLVKFLKEHSDINEEFIDDFFGLYSFKDTYNFCIDVEVITKWLNIYKKHIVDILHAEYKENQDYKVVEKKIKEKGAGRPRNVIMLTPRCFKSLAMRGSSKKSKAVREYYLDLEELLLRYQNYIHEGLREKIRRLQHNQKPKINPEKGVIYILQAADNAGYYKVGRAKNLKKRLNAYNGDKIDDIQPLLVYETDNIEEVENCIKAFLKRHQYRNHKEIYEVDIDILKKMVKECAELGDKLFLKKKYKESKQLGGNYLMAIYRET